MTSQEIVAPNEKYCWACKEFKSYSEFGKDKSKSDGHNGDCKKCKNERGKLYWQKYKPPVKIKTRERRGYVDASFANTRRQVFKREKSTKEVKLIYQDAYERQQGLCAICKQPETAKHQKGKTRRLAMDHCHVTGKFRGLLCFQCNSMLGRLKDNPETFLEIVDYLQKD